MSEIMYNVVLYIALFLFYSICGWVLEVIYCVIDDTRINKKFTITNRGFLNGPYCPIYGSAAIMMALTLMPLADTPILLFFVGILVCDAVEYTTSFVMEKVFNARWWDYSHEFLNINGRICFKHSMMWGCLSLVFIKYIHPPILELFRRVDENLLFIASVGFLMIFLYDVFIALITTISIRSFQNQLHRIKEAFSDIAPTTVLKRSDIPQYISDYRDSIKAITNAHVRERFKHLRHEYPEIFRLMMEEISEIQSVPSEFRNELKSLRSDLQALIKEQQEKRSKDKD